MTDCEDQLNDKNRGGMMALRIVALLALLWTTAGQAADADCGCPPSKPWPWHPTWYIGGGATATDDRGGRLPDDGSFVAHDKQERASGFRGYGGVEVLKFVGLELGYADYGEVSEMARSDGSGSFYAAGPQSASEKLKGLDFSLLGTLPISPNFRLYARAGEVRWQGWSTVAINAQSFGSRLMRSGRHNTKGLWGAGVNYDGLRPVRLSLGYTYTTTHNEFAANYERVQAVAVSLAYLF